MRKQKSYNLVGILERALGLTMSVAYDSDYADSVKAGYVDLAEGPKLGLVLPVNILFGHLDKARST